jgi:hypothetical protein
LFLLCELLSRRHQRQAFRIDVCTGVAIIAHRPGMAASKPTAAAC